MNKIFLTVAALAVFSVSSPLYAADAKKDGGLGAVDINKDGAVSKDEADKVATAQFTAFDADKDGKVTETEFKNEIYKANKAPPPADQKAKVDKMISQRFDAQDPDKDGVIAKAEYMEDATRRHKAMDMNGDGKVTKQELADLKTKLKAAMKKQLETQKKAQ